MAKFLFTVWPVPGHIHPNIAVAHALRKRGHEVRFYTGADVHPIIEGEGFSYFPFRSMSDDVFRRIVLSPEGIISTRTNPLKASKLWREFLLETVPAQVEDVNSVIDEWHPDVIVSDPSMWGSIFVIHESRDIPVAVFSYLIACLLPGRDAPLHAVSLPRPHNWLTRMRANVIRSAVTLSAKLVIRRTNSIRADNGLPPLETSLNGFTGQMPLYLMSGSAAFDYQRDDLPESVHYVGACIWNKPTGQPPPDWLTQMPDDVPLVYVTEGTIPEKFPAVLNAAVQGLGGLPMNVVITTGTHRTASDLGLDNVPPNIRVEQWVPLSDLLERVDLVVTTGGSNTVLGALSKGLPQLVIPRLWDQPENAWRVVEANAGLRLSYNRCSPERLRESVQRLLSEPSFKQGAQRLASDLNEYGGAPYAAELLEGLSQNNASQDTSTNSA